MEGDRAGNTREQPETYVSRVVSQFMESLLLLQIGRSLNALPIGRIVTGHFTGRNGYGALREVLGSRVAYTATGETISV